jgi:hypothetical protein
MSSYDRSANSTINPDIFTNPYLKQLALKYNRQDAEIARNKSYSQGLYNAATDTVITNNPTTSGTCMIHVYYGCQPNIGSVIGL